MILSSIYAFISSLAFGVIFNIRGRNLIFASFGGGLAWFVYLLSLSLQNSELTSLFLSTFAAAIYSEIAARSLKAPVTIFIICAVIPAVPGGGMYYTMLESIRGNINEALTLGTTTLLKAGAIAVAIALVSSMTKLITYFFKKKEKV